jgi:hypothetical protein
MSNDPQLDQTTTDPATDETKKPDDATGIEENTTGQDQGSDTNDEEKQPEVTEEKSNTQEADTSIVGTVATREEKPVDTTTVVTTEETEQDKSEVAKVIEGLKENGSKTEKTLIRSLEAYITAMAPGKPNDGDSGARHQYGLWQTIRSIAQSSPDEDFKRLWGILLAFVEEHKEGAFADRYLFRFAESWRHDKSELDGFQRVLQLIKLTSNPAERAKGLRQVDLTRTLESGFTEQARSRIVQYYS